MSCTIYPKTRQLDNTIETAGVALSIHGIVGSFRTIRRIYGPNSTKYDKSFMYSRRAIRHRQPVLDTPSTTGQSSDRRIHHPIHQHFVLPYHPAEADVVPASSVYHRRSTFISARHHTTEVRHTWVLLRHQPAGQDLSPWCYWRYAMLTFGIEQDRHGRNGVWWERPGRHSATMVDSSFGRDRPHEAADR